jgi:hypothetical protein
MSLSDALLDFDVRNNLLHYEVRVVVKEFMNHEKFSVVGYMRLANVCNVGMGEPGYFATLFDRIDKKCRMRIFLTEEEYDRLETSYPLDVDIEVCAWGFKKNKEYHCSMVKSADYMKRYHML